MKKSALLAMLSIISLGGAAFAQETTTDFGEREFKTSCAVCHGEAAKGNGIVVSSLKIAPPDLTLLAKKNGGVFPVKHLYDVIDGRARIAVHGSRDMPIWGMRYSRIAPEHYNQDVYVRTRIINLIDYLDRIQQK
jgi:mono/diheme cytochrome c family protein